MPKITADSFEGIHNQLKDVLKNAVGDKNKTINETSIELSRVIRYGSIEVSRSKAYTLKVSDAGNIFCECSKIYSWQDALDDFFLRLWDGYFSTFGVERAAVRT